MLHMISRKKRKMEKNRELMSVKLMSQQSFVSEDKLKKKEAYILVAGIFVKIQGT